MIKSWATYRRERLLDRVPIGNPPIADDPYTCVDLTEGDAKQEPDMDGGQSETDYTAGAKQMQNKQSVTGTVFESQTSAGKAFQRALTCNPEIHAIYKFLGNKEKQRFRESWIKERDWEFVKNTKISEQRSVRMADESGCYLTLTQVAAKYGSADSDACIEKAKAYCELCRSRGGEWLLDSPEHGEMFWYSEKTYKERHSDSKIESVEMSTTENLWETRSKERKALVSYAAAAGKRPECVTMDQVRSSDLGVEGWAAAVVAPNMVKPPAPKKAARKLSDSEVDVKKAKENTAKLLRCSEILDELKAEKEQNRNLAWQFTTLYDM